MSELAFDALSGMTVGNYRLLRLMEHNQTGPTYLANTTTDAATYRLRFMVGSTNVDKRWFKENLYRFYALARQLVDLQHPHILHLLDYGMYQDIPYLVTPNFTIRTL